VKGLRQAADPGASDGREHGNLIDFRKLDFPVIAERTITV